MLMTWPENNVFASESCDTVFLIGGFGTCSRVRRFQNRQELVRGLDKSEGSRKSKRIKIKIDRCQGQHGAVIKSRERFTCRRSIHCCWRCTTVDGYDHYLVPRPYRTDRPHLRFRAGPLPHAEKTHVAGAFLVPAA